MGASEVSDPIDAAIDKTEAPLQESLQNRLSLPDGGVINLVVPADFDSDDFESAIAGLVQLRSIVEQRKAAEAAKEHPIAVPTRTIVDPAGRPIGRKGMS